MCVRERKRKKERGRSGVFSGPSGVWRSRARKTKSQRKSEDIYRCRWTCVEEKKQEKKRKKKRMDGKKKKLKKERKYNIRNKKSKLSNITMIFS